MWSLGCILAELLTGYPLLPGEDEGDQLSCIIELLGMPPQKLLDQSKRAKNFISSKGKYLQSSELHNFSSKICCNKLSCPLLHVMPNSLNTNSQKEKEIFFFKRCPFKGRLSIYCFLTLLICRYCEKTSHGVETHERQREALVLKNINDVSSFLVL